MIRLDNRFILPVILTLGLLTQVAPPVESGSGVRESSDGVVALPGAGLDLGPNAWTAWERQVYSKLQQSFNQPSPLAEGTKGMVSGTSAALAVHAGLNALEAGGSAMDAALTTALSQVVLDAGCWNSYAGILNLIYYDAPTGKVVTLNGGYNIPRAETTPETIPDRSNVDGRAVLVVFFLH